MAEYDYIYAVTLIFRSEPSDLEEAEKHLRRALQAKPKYDNFAKAAFNLGLVQRRMKKYDEAAETFRKTLDLTDADDNHAQYGMALWELGRHDEARQQFETALRANPKRAEALQGMGLVYLRQGKNREALQSFQAAVEANPNLPQAWSDLGVAEGRLNHWNEAVAKHNDARLRAYPYSDRALYLRRLALALHVENRLDEARNFYAEATQVQPDWREVNQEKAWKIATSPSPPPGDAATAWELAAQASQAVANPSAHDLDVEAAAHAANGRFGDAASMAREAIKKASPEQAKEIAKRLALYEMKTAYIREEK
jgi:tetratricopeptide (TPR) repeat protein